MKVEYLRSFVRSYVQFLYTCGVYRPMLPMRWPIDTNSHTHTHTNEKLLVVLTKRTNVRHQSMPIPKIAFRTNRCTSSSRLTHKNKKWIKRFIFFGIRFTYGLHECAECRYCCTHSTLYEKSMAIPECIRQLRQWQQQRPTRQRNTN